MRLSGLALASLACGIVAADYKTVLADIAQISNATKLLDFDVGFVTAGIPGFPFALQVQVDAVGLHKQINTGASDASSSPAFGTVGSAQISSQLLQLKSTVSKALDDVTSKASAFGDVKPVVLASLYQLKQDTDKFGAAIIAKLSPLEAAVAPAVVKSFDASFNKAIVAYGGTAQCKLSIVLVLLLSTDI